MNKIFNKAFALVFAIAMIFTCAVPSLKADAATVYRSSRATAGTYVVANMSEFDCGVEVHSSASYSSSRLTTIHCNTSYKYISSTTDASGRPWYKIYYSGSKSGYVCGYYAHTVSVVDNNYVITPGSGINMRKGPSTGYDSYGTSYANTYYSIIGAAGENFSVTGTKWIQCADNTGKVFWFKASLLSGVKLSSNVTCCDASPSKYTAYDYRFTGASNVRTGPSTSDGKVRSSTFSTKCAVYINGVVLNKSNEIWYKVSVIDSGKSYSGYVLGTLLK